MAETYQLIAIATFSVAGICLILSIFMWFKFEIPVIYKEVSGKNREKVIAKYRTEYDHKQNQQVAMNGQDNVEESFVIIYEKLVIGTNETIN